MRLCKVIEANLKRRHLTDFQKAELGHLLEPIERELAKRRQMEEGAKYGRGHKKEETLESNEPKDIEQGKTSEIVAMKVGLSPTTYQRAKTIIEKAREELKEKVLPLPLRELAIFKKTLLFSILSNSRWNYRIVQSILQTSHK